MIDKIHKIGIGSVQFGLNYGISNEKGKTSFKEVGKILNYAVKEGINLLDTAFAYGDSEEVLGQFDLSEFHVVTKFPKLNGKKIFPFFNESIERLKIPSVYGYLAHSASDLLNSKENIKSLRILKDLGKVEKIGASLYFVNEFRELIEKGFVPDLIQIPFNILDQRFRKEFDYIKSLGTEIHVRSTFLQGLFFKSPSELSAFFDPLKTELERFISNYPDNQDRVAALINFNLSFEAVDKIVIGVNNQAQLQKNISTVINHKSFEYNLESKIPEEILLPFNWPK